MLRRLATTLGIGAALGALVLAPVASAGNTSKLSGTITGPYSAVTGFATTTTSASLGSHLTFNVTYSGFKNTVQPYVYAACYQSGLLVYGAMVPASTGVGDFAKFGYDSQWSLTGGSADCTVSLVAYAGVGHGGTLGWLDSVSFTAAG
jgi:hypothetical protein